jgi:hypothetical protein
MSIQFDVKFNAKTTLDKLKTIRTQLSNVPTEAYQYFKNITPIDTGAARSNTSLQGRTIQAKYAYAEVLDKGRHMTASGMRGSKQAPRGMSKPTEQFIKNRVRQITGK